MQGDAPMTRAVIASLIAAAALAAVDIRPSSAEVYRPWCVQYFGGLSGGTNCSFYSYAQCMETARGNGAYCYQNPWYLQYGSGSPPDARPRDKQR
jgi:hypothetical protein